MLKKLQQQTLAKRIRDTAKKIQNGSNLGSSQIPAHEHSYDQLMTALTGSARLSSKTNLERWTYLLDTLERVPVVPRNARPKLGELLYQITTGLGPKNIVVLQTQSSSPASWVGSTKRKDFTVHYQSWSRHHKVIEDHVGLANPITRDLVRNLPKEKIPYPRKLDEQKQARPPWMLRDSICDALVYPATEDVFESLTPGDNFTAENYEPWHGWTIITGKAKDFPEKEPVIGYLVSTISMAGTDYQIAVYKPVDYAPKVVKKKIEDLSPSHLTVAVEEICQKILHATKETKHMTTNEIGSEEFVIDIDPKRDFNDIETAPGAFREWRPRFTITLAQEGHNYTEEALAKIEAQEYDMPLISDATFLTMGRNTGTREVTLNKNIFDTLTPWQQEALVAMTLALDEDQKFTNPDPFLDPDKHPGARTFTLTSNGMRDESNSYVVSPYAESPNQVVSAHVFNELVKDKNRRVLWVHQTDPRRRFFGATNDHDNIYDVLFQTGISREDIITVPSLKDYTTNELSDFWEKLPNKGPGVLLVHERALATQRRASITQWLSKDKNSPLLVCWPQMDSKTVVQFSDQPPPLVASVPNLKTVHVHPPMRLQLTDPFRKAVNEGYLFSNEDVVRSTFHHLSQSNLGYSYVEPVKGQVHPRGGYNIVAQPITQTPNERKLYDRWVRVWNKLDESESVDEKTRNRFFAALIGACHGRAITENLKRDIKDGLMPVVHYPYNPATDCLVPQGMLVNNSEIREDEHGKPLKAPAKKPPHFLKNYAQALFRENFDTRRTSYDRSSRNEEAISSDDPNEAHDSSRVSTLGKMLAHFLQVGDERKTLESAILDAVNGDPKKVLVLINHQDPQHTPNRKGFKLVVVPCNIPNNLVPSHSLQQSSSEDDDEDQDFNKLPPEVSNKIIQDDEPINRMFPFNSILSSKKKPLVHYVPGALPFAVEDGTPDTDLEASNSDLERKEDNGHNPYSWSADYITCLQSDTRTEDQTTEIRLPISDVPADRFRLSVTANVLAQNIIGKIKIAPELERIPNPNTWYGAEASCHTKNWPGSIAKLSQLSLGEQSELAQSWDQEWAQVMTSKKNPIPTIQMGRRHEIEARGPSIPIAKSEGGIIMLPGIDPDIARIQIYDSQTPWQFLIQRHYAFYDMSHNRAFAPSPSHPLSKTLGNPEFDHMGTLFTKRQDMYQAFLEAQNISPTKLKAKNITPHAGKPYTWLARYLVRDGNRYGMLVPQAGNDKDLNLFVLEFAPTGASLVALDRKAGWAPTEDLTKEDEVKLRPGQAAKKSDAPWFDRGCPMPNKRYGGLVTSPLFFLEGDVGAPTRNLSNWCTPWGIEHMFAKPNPSVGEPDYITRKTGVVLGLNDVINLVVNTAIENEYKLIP